MENCEQSYIFKRQAIYDTTQTISHHLVERLRLRLDPPQGTKGSFDSTCLLVVHSSAKAI